MTINLVLETRNLRLTVVKPSIQGYKSGSEPRPAQLPGSGLPWERLAFLMESIYLSLCYQLAVRYHLCSGVLPSVPAP